MWWHGRHFLYRVNVSVFFLHSISLGLLKASHFLCGVHLLGHTTKHGKCKQPSASCCIMMSCLILGGHGVFTFLLSALWRLWALQNSMAVVVFILVSFCCCCVVSYVQLTNKKHGVLLVWRLKLNDIAWTFYLIFFVALCSCNLVRFGGFVWRRIVSVFFWGLWVRETNENKEFIFCYLLLYYLR